MATQPLRVVIADDHPIVRDGLITLLASSPQVTVVGVAMTFTEVLNILGTVPVDVLVLDLTGMGGAPLTLVTRVRRDYPQVAIIVFSSTVDLAPELLQAGVRGYVAKEELSDQLLTALQAVMFGQIFLSPIAEEYVTRATSKKFQHRLAPQELNVLKLLALGFGTTAIGEQLGIDPRTVQNYITTLRRKTGCNERTQLVGWYVRVYGKPGHT